MHSNRIMVFGGGTLLNERKKVSLNQASIERAERTVEYFNENKEWFRKVGSFILCTGGFGLLSAGIQEQSPEDREAVLMADYLIKKGVPEDLLMLEQVSTSTLTNWTQSMKFYGDLLDPSLFTPDDTLGLVSHPYHLNRIIYFATQLGYAEDSLERIHTQEYDNEQYEAQVLAAYKEYIGDAHNPLEMEQKEKELARNVELMTHLRQLQ